MESSWGFDEFSPIYARKLIPRTSKTQIFVDEEYFKELNMTFPLTIRGVRSKDAQKEVSSWMQIESVEKLLIS